MVYNIQRYSTHDGTGIRTMIFYKGCPLRCAWCSNPESQTFEPSLMFDQRLCKHFGDCQRIEPLGITHNGNGIRLNRSMIRDPEKLRDTCLSRAITVAGEEKSVQELLVEIEKDIPFYNQSNGGVTLSGGEPLSQDEGMVDLLRALKHSRIDVAVETSLHVAWENVERCIGWVDTFLVDLKHVDHDKFRQYTGGNAALVLANLKKLAAKGERIIIRVPVIPGFNHTRQEMQKIIDFAVSLPTVREMHFIPYHTLGIEKYKMLDMQVPFACTKPVEHAELEGYLQYAREKGLKTRIGG